MTDFATFGTNHLPVDPLRPEYAHPKSEVNVWFVVVTAGTLPPKIQKETLQIVRKNMHMDISYSYVNTDLNTVNPV